MISLEFYIFGILHETLCETFENKCCLTAGVVTLFSVLHFYVFPPVEEQTRFMHFPFSSCMCLPFVFHDLHDTCDALIAN